MTHKIGSISLWVGLFLVSQNALGQSDKSVFDLSLAELMQVKVTAEKRERPWIDVPQTIDVYSGAELRNQNVSSLRSLAEVAPGFSYSRDGNIPANYLRGIGSDLISIAADASTAVYLDDVYLSRPEMAIADFWDVDRIEILKGPQGALYGRNAIGGAIKIVSARAHFDKTEGYANVATGSFNERKLETAANIPLTDSVATRVSFLSIQDDGYTRDLDPVGGNLIDDNKVAAGRVELRWQLDENLESAFIADYYQNNNHGASIRANDHKGIAEAQGAFNPEDFHAVLNNVPSFSDYSTQGVTWRWHWSGEQAVLESVSAYRKVDSNYLFNTDGTNVDVVESELLTQQEQYSHDIYLQSKDDTVFRWMIGANWLQEKPLMRAALIRHPIKTSIVTVAQANTRAWALYGELGWKINSQWDSTLRLRNSDERRSDTNSRFPTGDLLGLKSPSVDLPHPVTADRTSSFKKLSPQWIVNFVPETVTGQSLWYLNVTEGYKSGGANSLTASPNFKPEEILSYELGYKNIATTGRWNVSVFHYNYKDLQVLTFENGMTVIRNAASVDTNGMDVAKVFNLNEKMQYDVGITFLRAKYSKFITSQAGTAKDVSGNTMPHAPQVDFNQSIRKQFNLASGIFDIELTHHYQSKTYFSQFEDAAVSQSARHRFDLIANWGFSDRWNLHAAIYNVTDKNYYQNIALRPTTSIATAPEGNALGPTAPGRRWVLGVDLRY